MNNVICLSAALSSVGVAIAYPVLAESASSKGNSEDFDTLVVSLPSAEPERDTKVVENTTVLEANMSQVTSVSQLSDVTIIPNHWAYQALTSLVERYGCIVGYPDRTYRGNQYLTRYEFAAGLNACLNRIEEIIKSNTGGFATQADLDAIKKLQEEFAAELATLRGRVDSLEARTATLEKQQFATLTKLNGELVSFLGDAFGDRAGDLNTTAFGYRLRFDIDTSFTGKDRLRVRLQSTNLRRLSSGTLFPAGTGDTDETRFLASSNSSDGGVTINRLQYRFPVGDRITLYLDANSIDPSIVTDPISPFNDQVLGAVSNFAQIDPVWFPIGNQAGLSANFVISPTLTLTLSYMGETDVNNPNVGIFNGGYSAFAHLVYDIKKFKIGFFYINSYSPNFGVDTLAGSNPAKVIGAGPVVGNGYSVQFSYQPSDGFVVGGWVGHTQARALGFGTRGDAEIWNFAANIGFPDLGGKGNLFGFVFGMQPKLTGTSNATLAQAIGLPLGQRADRDTGFHIEAFYRIRLSDNLSITPGVFWLTAPNHDSRNPDAVVGVIRTTFLF